jgi:DNA-binding MarR family transcriptional regulator
MALPPEPTPPDWLPHSTGEWLRRAQQRFDGRVMQLMANHPGVPLALSNLAARNQVTAAHRHITRHLPTPGARLTTLARNAGMTKQAMGTLVTQCEAWGMVRREPDAHDARASRVCFTPLGLAWLSAYRESAAQAEREMRAAIGDEVVTVINIGLEAYSEP